MEALRGTAAFTVAVLVLLLALPRAQAPSAPPFTIIARDGRRPLPATLLNGQDLVALDDVASILQGTLRDDPVVGGFTLAYRGRTIAGSANQSTVSVNGRVVALPSPVVRVGRRWLVPVEFLQAAMGTADPRIQVRRASRLVLVGDVRVPRVAVRIETPGPPTRAVVEISPASMVTVASEPGRITLRIDADALDLALPPAGAGLIAQIRAGDQPAAIVMALEGAAGAARITPQTTEPITRLLVEVPASAAPSTAAPEPAGPPASPLPPVTAEALLAPRPALHTIAIDPGHGGSDSGVRGGSGAEEKQIVLDVARRLRTVLETRLGVHVLLTRDADTAVAPDTRSTAANNNKADLFLSLHVNGAPTPKMAGAQVYYLQLGREGEAARDEASRRAAALPVLGGGTRLLDIVPWDLAQARHVDDSAALAGLVAEELKRHVAMTATPVRPAPLRVLEGLNMPAVVVEMGFLTNPAQDALIKSDNFKDGVAQALYDAVVRFRSRLEAQRSR